MTTKTVEPAFTPKEWAEIGTPDVAYPHKGMALGNASLPDDHPGKITHADVAALRALIDLSCTCGVVTAEDGKAWDDAVVRVPALADKLAALLPPE